MKNELAAPTILEVPTPSQVKAARLAAKLTQLDCARLFGYSGVRSWQKKEEIGDSRRTITVGEYNYLLLLANQHPQFILIERPKLDE